MVLLVLPDGNAIDFVIVTFIYLKIVLMVVVSFLKYMYLTSHCAKLDFTIA
jgi:hypothetical protein